MILITEMVRLINLNRTNYQTRGEKEEPTSTVLKMGQTMPHPGGNQLKPIGHARPGLLIIHLIHNNRDMAQTPGSSFSSLSLSLMKIKPLINSIYSNQKIKWYLCSCDFLQL